MTQDRRLQMVYISSVTEGMKGCKAASKRITPCSVRTRILFAGSFSVYSRGFTSSMYQSQNSSQTTVNFAAYTNSYLSKLTELSYRSLTLLKIHHFGLFRPGLVDIAKSMSSSKFINTNSGSVPYFICKISSRQICRREPQIVPETPYNQAKRSASFVIFDYLQRIDSVA